MRPSAIRAWLRGASARGQNRNQRVDPERRRLTYSLLLSLMIHALLLRVLFDGQGWIRGFGFAWRVPAFDSRVLSVVLAPPETAVHAAITPIVEPAEQARVGQPLASGPVMTPSGSTAIPGSFVASIVPRAGPSAEAQPGMDAPPATNAQPIPDVRPVTVAKPKTAIQPRTHASKAGATPGAVAAKSHRRPRQSGESGLPRGLPPPDVVALERADEPTWSVPVTPAMPTPAIEPSSSVASPETAASSVREADGPARTENAPDASEAAVEPTKPEVSAQDSAIQERQEVPAQEAIRENAGAETALESRPEETARQAAAEQETQRQEVARQEAARPETAQLEAERQEAARQAAAQQEAAQQEAQRQEAARQAAAVQEAQRQEVARQEAARAESARLEAERQDAAWQAAAQQEAQRQEVARQEAARAESARLEAERQEAARQAAAQRQEIARQEEAREERLRAIGRQLDEEAARREAASNARLPSTLPLSLSLARRVKLWGRYHANPELVRYAEAWARKIQANTPVETVREIAKQPHTAPLVTVAIRSDGSVESVTIEVSSGATQVDETLRRIVDGQKPYQAFEPELAREFDVIEIRRTWHFGSAVQLD